MIKQIYFDAGKVIFTRQIPDGDNITKLLGLKKEDYLPLMDKVISLQDEQENKKFWDIRNIDQEYEYLDEFHKKMCDYLNIKYDKEFIKKLSDCRVKADFAVNDGVITTLESLKEKYKLSILSNALPSRRHHELLMDNLISYFDPIIISFEIGLHKPDVKIFQHALDISDFNPEEIAFVDDKEENLIIAKNAGFGKCILFGSSSNAEFQGVKTFTELLDHF